MNYSTLGIDTHAKIVKYVRSKLNEYINTTNVIDRILMIQDILKNIMSMLFELDGKIQDMSPGLDDLYKFLYNQESRYQFYDLTIGSDKVVKLDSESIILVGVDKLIVMHFSDIVMLMNKTSQIDHDIADSLLVSAYGKNWRFHGSKKSLIMKFVEHISKEIVPHNSTPVELDDILNLYNN